MTQYPCRKRTSTHSDWLSSRYVSGVAGIGRFSYFIQVLTGEFPFRGTGKVELGWFVVHGLRPDKPDYTRERFIHRLF